MRRSDVAQAQEYTAELEAQIIEERGDKPTLQVYPGMPSCTLCCIGHPGRTCEEERESRRRHEVKRSNIDWHHYEDRPRWEEDGYDLVREEREEVPADNPIERRQRSER
jgi:hypothetical protein